jgi:hypothetical protein
MRGVATAAKAYGLDVTKTTKETDEWSSAMARLAGVADDQVIRAVGEQLTLTGSLEQAQHRVTLALDYAEYAAGRDASWVGAGIDPAPLHAEAVALLAEWAPTGDTRDIRGEADSNENRLA